MTNRVVVITGASAGIGAALAIEVGKRGDLPVLVARRERELGEVAARCGEAATTVVADVTRREEHERIVATTLARHGRIDAWVNNAGRGISRNVSELSDADLDEMMLVNVKSVLYGMQAVLPHFRARRREGGLGHIVNVSSLLGRVPFATIRSAYSASKHAMNALSASLRMELRSSSPGIVVTVVHPGVVATEFGLNALHGGPDSRQMPGSQTAEEVAAVIADALESRAVDVYTRPGAREMIAAYYAAEDLAEHEAKLGPPRR